MTDLQEVVAMLPWIDKPGGPCLVGQRLPDIALGNHWELPGGTKREDETEEEGIFREASEEFPGFGIKIIRRIGESISGKIKLIVYEVVYTGGGFFPRAHSNIAFPHIDEIIGRYNPIAPADIPIIRKVEEMYQG